VTYLSTIRIPFYGYFCNIESNNFLEGGSVLNR